MSVVIERDVLIGEAVAFHRGPRSQKSLGEAMRARGHRWSQATVWSVEKGDRPLKLAEAVDVAAELGVELDTLLRPPEGLPARWQVDQVLSRVDAAWTAVRGGRHQLGEAQGELRGLVGDDATDPAVQAALGLDVALSGDEEPLRARLVDSMGGQTIYVDRER